MSQGYVYFIEAESTGYVKIGWAKHNPFERIKMLQTGCPGLLFVRAYFPGSRDDEHRMHLTFDDLRARGEWFANVLKLSDFLGYLDHDGDEVGAPRVSTLHQVAIAIHDCVKTGHWYPDYPVSEKLYDMSGDWRPWRHLLLEQFGEDEG